MTENIVNLHGSGINHKVSLERREVFSQSEFFCLKAVPNPEIPFTVLGIPFTRVTVNLD